ncbi:hypothetical protein [Serratia marcescens]|uniref:hypothetical protein n=1 Tax=Serratia marcescens TaxID=615 RepID=UPI00148C6143|nr:hypothetical protein [Serratia marcescens]QJU42303.1 hypothetical protein HMI62_24665 [Serratia marcescens]
MVILANAIYNKAFFYAFLTCIFLSLNGCSSTSGFSPLFLKGDDESREQVLRELQCDKGQLAKGEGVMPPALYQQMNRCIEQDNYRAATLLFSLAGTYSWYDAARVDTPLAKSQHSALLADTLVSLSSAKRDMFWGYIQSILGSPQQLKVVCHKIRLIGRPQYQATYMQQQNLGREDLNARERWALALVSYLHCPNTGE